MNKLTTKSIFIIIFLSFYILITSIIFYKFLEPTFHPIQQWERDKSFGLNIHVNGIIDSSFQDQNKHNVPTAKLKNGVIFYLPCTCTEEFIKGDSVLKNKGDMLLYKYRKGRLVGLYSYYTTLDKAYLDSIQTIYPNVRIK